MKYTTTIVIIVSLVFFSCKEEKTAAEESLLDKAHRIHEKVITIDTHNDINVKNFTDSINYTQLLETQVNLPKMKTGGLDVSRLIVYTGQDSLTSNGYLKASENAMKKFDAIHRLCEQIAPEEIGLALTSDDVRSIYASGQKVDTLTIDL